MVKLIASDMDGTLLDSKGNLPKEFDLVAEELISKGITLVAASGRQYYTLRDLFNNIKDEMVFISENGSYVMYKDKEIYSSVIPRGKIQEILSSISDIQGIEVVFCGKKGAYVLSKEERFIKEVEKYYHKYKVVQDFSKVQDEVVKLAIFDRIGAEDNSDKFVRPIWGEEYKVTISGIDWLDITNKATNKGNSLKAVIEMLNINKDETMAFGDYLNDLEMLQEVNYSYAMMNAHEEVKKHSKFLAKTNDENGVIEVIKEKVLKVI